MKELAHPGTRAVPLSEPDSDFTNERPPGGEDLTAQPLRPAYDYGPDLEDVRGRSIRQAPSVSLTRAAGCIVAGLLAGFLATFIFLVVMCSR